MSKLLNTFQWLKRKPGRLSVGLIMTAMMAASCSDMDEYFETPSWLRGSVYETLEGDGNYSVFLSAAEKAGFRPILESNIVTVMAPTDDKMRTYLQENYGTTDVGSIDAAELKKLIGFHIFHYSFDKDMLTNFRPNEGDGATEEEKLENAGMYYKFRTRSQDPISLEHGTVIDGTDTIETDVRVYHFDRFAPVYSYQMFRTKGINAASNYNYFYPGMWKDDAGFNVCNAGVDEYAVPTSNGYIYRVNQVMTPLNTIYNELKARSGEGVDPSKSYSRYLKMYDNYSRYAVSENITSNDGTPLYYHLHDKGNSGLPNIALEWPVADYTMVTTLSSAAHTVFAFSDKAFEDFFKDYWGLGGYTSMEDPDLQESIKELLMNSFASKVNNEAATIVFPEELNNGWVTNKENEPIAVNTDAVSDRVICSNGLLYGCGELIPTPKYSSVTGPAYQYKKYSYFLNMLKSSGLTGTLSAQNLSFIMLYPSNQQMKAQEGYDLVKLKEDDATQTLINTESPNGVSNSLKSAMIYAHAAQCVDGNSVLPTSGTKVIRALTDDMKLYWYVKDGKITNSIRYNDMLRYDGNEPDANNVWASFDFIPYRGDNDGWSNGHAYAYDNLLLPGNFARSRYSSFIDLMWSSNRMPNTDFYAWVNLLSKAGLINSRTGKMDELDNTETYLMFVPLTNVLEQAIIDGKIPGVTASGVSVGDEAFFDGVTVDAGQLETLQAYLRSYFVPMSTAVISNYPYLGWGETTTADGGLSTLDNKTMEIAGEMSIVDTKLNIYDNGSKLSVARRHYESSAETAAVNVSGKYDFLPFTFADACVHFLDGVLPVQNGK